MAEMSTDLDRLHTRLFVLLLLLVVALVALLTACGSWSRESGSLVGAIVTGRALEWGQHWSRRPRHNLTIYRRLSDGEIRVDYGTPDPSDNLGHARVWGGYGETGFWLESLQWFKMRIEVSSFGANLTPEEELEARRQARDYFVLLRGAPASAAHADRLRRLGMEDIEDAWFDPLGAALEIIASLLAIAIVVVGANWALVAVRVARTPRVIAVRQPRREVCGRCGYDVRGLSVCPECGNGRRRGDPTRRET